LSNRPNGSIKKGEGKGELSLLSDFLFSPNHTLFCQGCYFRGSCELKKNIINDPSGITLRLYFFEARFHSGFLVFDIFRLYKGAYSRG